MEGTRDVRLPSYMDISGRYLQSWRDAVRDRVSKGPIWGCKLVFFLLSIVPENSRFISYTQERSDDRLMTIVARGSRPQLRQLPPECPEVSSPLAALVLLFLLSSPKNFPNRLHRYSFSSHFISHSGALKNNQRMLGWWSGESANIFWGEREISGCRSKVYALSSFLTLSRFLLFENICSGLLNHTESVIYYYLLLFDYLQFFIFS